MAAYLYLETCQYLPLAHCSIVQEYRNYGSTSLFSSMSISATCTLSYSGLRGTMAAYLYLEACQYLPLAHCSTIKYRQV